MTVEAVAGDVKIEKKAAFCRLDRLEKPAAECLFADASGTLQMLALRAGGVRLLRLPVAGAKSIERAQRRVEQHLADDAAQAPAVGRGRRARAS